MNALIVVDIQNDFLPGGALAVPHGNEVIELANQLMGRFSLVVATQDWHPTGHQSFASSHPGKSVGDIIHLNNQPQILWPDHCVQETSGAEFAKELLSEKFHKIVRKGTNLEIDSYSGFFDNGHLADSGLESYLRNQDVTHCFVIGLATDYCVKFTALDSKNCGFETSVIIDGCRAVNLSPDDGTNAIKELHEAGVQVLKSSEINSSHSA